MSSVLYIQIAQSFMLVCSGLIYGLFAQVVSVTGNESLDTLINGGALAGLIALMWYIVRHQTKNLNAERKKNDLLLQDKINELKEENSELKMQLRGRDK